jgi:hypothetical protein
MFMRIREVMIPVAVSSDRLRWKCLCCGRDKFDRPYQPHRCGSNYVSHFSRSKGITFVPVTLESAVAERLMNGSQRQ